MKKARIIASLVLMIRSLSLLGQENPEQSPSSSTLTEPLDLQKANLQRIRRRTELDRIRAIRLLEYRREHSPIQSFYELHYLEGFTPATVRMLRENCFIGKLEYHDSLSLRDALRNIEGKFRFRWGRTLQKRVGYRTNAYRGPRDAFKGQLRAEVPGILTAVGNLEKDAGEPWWDEKKDPPIGMSGSLKLHSQGILEKAVLGPIRTQSGGGLLVDNGGGFLGGIGPSSGPLFTLEPHTGSPDRIGLKGLGAECRIEEFRGALLYSRKKWTARTVSTRGSKEKIRTLYRNGLYRDPGRLRWRDAWERTDLIAHAAWKGSKASFSASYHYGRSSAPFAQPRFIRDLPSDRSREQNGTELHYRGRHERQRWSMSFAAQADGSKAFTAAFSTRPHNDLYIQGRVEAAGWGFDPFWSSLARNGRPFVRTTLTGDRVIAPGWRIGVEGGILYRKWAYYGRKAPGDEGTLDLTAVRSGEKGEQLEFGIEYERQEQDVGKEGIRNLPLNVRRSIGAELEAELRLSSELRNRIRINGERALEKGIPDGMMIAYDLVRSWEEKELKIYGRIAYFDAPSYRTRPYAYENDVLYAFSVRSYYRTGMRGYLLIRYGLTPQLTLEGKIGSWAYRNVKEGRIGSGKAAISGRYRSSVRVQLRGSF